MRFRVKEGFKVRTSRKKTAVGEGVRRSEGAVRPSAGPGPESADGRASALPGRPKYASDEVSCRRNELQHYRMILPAGLAKFKRFAVNVWDVDPNGKSDRAVAEEGLDYAVADDTMRRPFDAPPLIVNWFFHEQVRRTAKKR